MRDIDNDIRNSLERLTDPHDNTRGTEALWGDLVDRRRKRRNRNHALAALPLLLVAVLAVGLFATQGSDDARSDVAAGGADVPSSDDIDGSWRIAATVNNGERQPATGTANLRFDGDQVQGDDGCNNSIDTTMENGVIVGPSVRTQVGCLGFRLTQEADLFWESLGHPLDIRDGELWLVNERGDGLIFERAGGADEAATGSLRVENIRVEGNGAFDGGTERVVIDFNEPLPVDRADFVPDMDFLDMPLSVLYTVQGADGVRVCDSVHSMPGTVDLLIPGTWFADEQAHEVAELETVNNPAKFVFCGPHNGFVQYSVWGPVSAAADDVTVTVSPDRTRIAIEVMPNGPSGPDVYQGRGFVGKFIDLVQTDEVEAAATLWSGYPVSEPDRPISERVQYVELLAEFPPFARVVASDTTTTFVTPSLDGYNRQVVTVLAPRSGDSPPAAVAFLTGPSREGDAERMWIQRLPAIDDAANTELSDDGYVEPGERVVVPGLPIEGVVRGFVNGVEVPVEVDLENETFTVVVPDNASGDIALTFVVATPEVTTPEEPIVRAFAATVKA